MHELIPYLRMLRRYRGQLALGAILMLATAASGIGLLALSGWFITATAVTGALLAAGVAASLEIYIPGGGIRAFAVTRTAARYFERITNHDSVLRLLRDLRGRVFRRLAATSAEDRANFASGELLNRLTTDVDRLDGLFLRGLAPPLVAFLAILIVAALLSIGSPLVALPAGGALLVVAGMALLTAWQSGQRSTTRLAGAQADLRAGLIDHIHGLGTLLAFGSLSAHQRRLDDLETTSRQAEAALAMAMARREAFLHGAVQLVAVGVLLAALWLFHRGAVTGAVAVMMPLAVLALLEPVGVLPGAGLNLAHARASAVRLDDGLARVGPDGPTRASSDIPDNAGDTGGAASGPVDVQIDGLTITRGAGARVVDDLSLAVAAGEHLAMIGPSGCGKSTLALALSGQIQPDQGKITLDGTPMADMPAAQRIHQVAFLTQQTELFSGSLQDNLQIANPSATDADFWRVLEAVALDGFARSLPEGLDTWVGESGTRLSGGQARRVALARLMLRDPSLVILDEPFSGLDAGTARHIDQALTDWLANRTALLLGHAETALPQADRLVEMRAGQAQQTTPG
ncbi:thiol reductant ABC exporter subunit CydC [Spiribacter sp. 218]|uniref:thiol reductant ABC exporter subunit CydC n=1 Tax=Spiribacter pallidus TaxID=1987936 RepID=UPI00349F174B